MTSVGFTGATTSGLCTVCSAGTYSSGPGVGSICSCRQRVQFFIFCLGVILEYCCLATLIQNYIHIVSTSVDNMNVGFLSSQYNFRLFTVGFDLSLAGASACTACITGTFSNYAGVVTRRQSILKI